MISFIITIRTWGHLARREGRTSKLATFRQFIVWCHQIYESSSHLVKPQIYIWMLNTLVSREVWHQIYVNDKVSPTDWAGGQQFVKLGPSRIVGQGYSQVGTFWCVLNISLCATRRSARIAFKKAWRDVWAARPSWIVGQGYSDSQSWRGHVFQAIYTGFNWPPLVQKNVTLRTRGPNWPPSVQKRYVTDTGPHIPF